MKPPLYFLKNTQHFFLFFQYSTKSVFLKLPVRYCSRLTLRAHLQGRQDIQKNVFKHKQTLKKNQVKTVTPVI